MENNANSPHIASLIADLDSKIEEQEQEKKGSIWSHERSRYITPVMATDLSELQSHYPVIGANKDNPYFKSKYADLDIIMRSVRQIIAKYGFSYSQDTHISESGSEILVTRLIHKSGGYTTSQTLINPPKADPQSYGSTLSYKKRYQLQLILGITISGDPADDDGEAVMKHVRIQEHKGNSRFASVNTSPHKIDEKQLAQLEHELENHPELVRQILSKMNIETLADMPESKFLRAIDRIREIKLTKPQHRN